MFVHDQNYGYGRNQQTCYREALAEGADVVIMVHPDYQYTPLLVTAMASMIAYGVYDVVLGSRIIGGQALRGGMPLYKYVSNRFLTAFENLFLRRQAVGISHRLSGLQPRSADRRCRCWKTPTILCSITRCSRSACISDSALAKFPVPTKYFEEASSINFRRSVKYGLGVLGTTLQFALQRWGLGHFRIFNENGKRLEPGLPAYYARGTAEGTQGIAG